MGNEHEVVMLSSVLALEIPIIMINNLSNAYHKC